MKDKATQHLLFIAPASIPVNGAEAIVNIKLLRLLVSKGYQIDVISKKARWEHYPLMQEEKLIKKLSSVTIIEVDNKVGFKTLWLHLRAWMRFKVLFKGVHWAFLASKKVEDLVSKNSYMCVLTKNYPSELVGCWSKKKYGLPWVATWNDPYPHERYPRPYGKGPQTQLPLLKRPILEQMSKYPNAHIFPSLRLCNYMQSYLHAEVNKLYVIPHIVESVANSSSLECPDQNKVVLKICYLGSLDGPRQPWTMLEAIEKIHQSQLSISIKVDFVGTIPNGMTQFIQDKKLENIVSAFPPVSYKESLDLLRKYDVALIIEAPCEEGVFLPSKVSDIMEVELPIFAISPKIGVLNDLFVNKNIQYFSDVTDIESIYQEFQRLMNDFNEKRISIPIIPDDYKSDNIAKQYDYIIENCSK